MKKLTSVLLILLLLAVSCATVTAASIYRSGDWTLTALEGETPRFGVRSYEGTDSEVTVPDNYGGYPIGAINAYAFAADKALQSVTMNDNITSIGAGAFMSAEKLTEVVLTPSVTALGESAFSSTPALKTLNLEDSSVERIEQNTFLNSGIETITLPDTCFAIADNAFAQCESLTDITIPESVTEIGTNAFRGTEGVTIHCYADSKAYEYAVENEIAYVVIEKPQPITFMLGDADGDGGINIIDATKIQRVLAELDEDNDGMIALHGDVNGNGLDILDATAVQRYIADYAVDAPIGEMMTVQI